MVPVVLSEAWLIAIRPSGKLIVQCSNASHDNGNTVYETTTCIYLRTYMLLICKHFTLSEFTLSTLRHQVADVQQPATQCSQ